MQWHRHQEVRLSEHLIAGAVHPASERAGKVSLVAVFQHQHQPPAVPVVAEHRPCAVPAWRPAGAGPANSALPHRVRKRQPAAVCDFTLDGNALSIHMVDMSNAYSFIRFSSPEQAKGDSLRRQLEASERFAAEHSLNLDTSFRDLGKSASKGEHVGATGALGRFIRLVESGQIKPGSWLIVEDMDRLDRRKVNIALKQFMSLLEAGLIVHTMIDNQTYTLERINEDPTALILSILKMIAAHDYTAKLGMRIQETWDRRRADMRAGRGKPTNACPGWLKAVDGKWAEIGDHVKVVKRIIAERHLGLGRHEISTRLNRERVPTFRGGDGWHPSTIAALVRNKALIGIYQPRKADGTLNGDPIEGFYPRLISDDDFWRAQWGPDNKLGAGRKTKGLANLLRGICKCGRCGASLIYLNTGKDNFLVCGRARRGLCDNRYHRTYAKLETELLSAFVLFDFSRLLDRANPQADRIAALEAEISAKTATVGRLLQDFKADTPPEVSKRIGVLSAEVKALTTELAEAKRVARIAEANETRDAYTEFRAMVAWLPRMADDERYLLRTRIAGELSRLIESATADGTTLTIALAPTPFCRVDIIIDRATISVFRITLTGCDEPIEPVVFPRAKVIADAPHLAGLFTRYVGTDAGRIAA